MTNPKSSSRPPAVPLITHDPYFCVWSTSDTLNGGVTKHWTGSEHPLNSLVRVDGETFRLMGAGPVELPAMNQTNLVVTPTRTLYTFKNQTVEVQLSFISPILADDIDVLARPVTYVTWDIKSIDGNRHQISVYFDASGLLTVDKPEQLVSGEVVAMDGLNTARVGCTEQAVLNRSGDDHRIDWGYLYLAGTVDDLSVAYVPSEQGLSSFVELGLLPDSANSNIGPASEGWALAATLSFGEVGDQGASRRLMVAYDDEYSIQYLGENLKPYWRKGGWEAADLLQAANAEFESLRARCEAFDAEMASDLELAGGSDYAFLGALAYRQSFAAQKVAAGIDGSPLMFSKENFSNGCIATVDVLYPAAPLLLLLSPSLMKASLAPILDYAASSRWTFPFAPHDLGQYPLANGQVYGGGEKTEDDQMPVEESGNMLILLAALAKIEGNADFSEKYWPEISKWADYLVKQGFDPEFQLCTDDFAGHLAHNVNLSAKAIEALGGYAYLCAISGRNEEAATVRVLAEQYAARWVIEASAGDHYRLAFDKEDSWSQKYNLIWDRLLNFRLFPESVVRTEMDYYLTKQNEYGLPLDNRKDYTKLDWIVWTATLTGERSDFDALIQPIVKFLNDTPDRIPMTDWYGTVAPNKVGFQARSVVGGVFIKLLENEETWRKYAGRFSAR